MRTVATLWMLALLGFSSASSSTPKAAAGEVTLALSGYLDLLERIEEARRLEKEIEPAVVELVAQRTEISVDGEAARLVTVFEVEVRGTPTEPLVLPLTGNAGRIAIDPPGGLAVHRGGDGVLEAVPFAPGSYRVRVEGGLALAHTDGRLALPLGRSTSPVATTGLDLPADLDWSCPGAVVVAEEVHGDRRHLRLALAPEKEHRLELTRTSHEEPAPEALVRVAEVTVVSVGREGPRRRDVLLHEVLRGELGRFEVTLPPGLSVERVATDEGEAVARVEGDRLTVQRARRLSGSGYLVLTAPPPPSGPLALTPVGTPWGLGARYLVLTATVAAEARPLPEAAWQPVDLGDLPEALRGELAALRPTAAWQQVDPEAPDELALEVQPLPAAPMAAALVADRETTTLLTPVGSLVHRDRFVVRRMSGALELELPTAAVVWSASVDGVEVRPVERGGRILVPLAFREGEESTGEVVTVEERAASAGRSRLGLLLPRVELPVLAHCWRLFLPEGGRYRWVGGTLFPVAQAEPPGPSFEGRGGSSVGGRFGITRNTTGVEPFGTGAVAGRVTSEDGEPLPGVVVELSSEGAGLVRQAVTDIHGAFALAGLPVGVMEVSAHLEGFNTVIHTVRLTSGERMRVEIFLGLATVAEEILVTASSDRWGSGVESKRERRKREAEALSRELLAAEKTRLQEGISRGVRPLPVALPESGKLLLLSGALPPAQVGAELVTVRKR